MKTIVSLVLILGLNVTSFAWNEKGNGGYVVKKSENFFLLDLVEAGVEEQVWKNPGINVHPKVLSFLQSHFGSDSFPHEELAAKLSEIHREAPFSAYAILKTIPLFHWNFVRTSLVRLEDIGESPIDLAQVEVYQAVIRWKDQIFINRDLFEAMSKDHRAALILHELIYVLSTPAKINEKMADQKNEETRHIVGKIFSNDMDPANGGFNRIVYRSEKSGTVFSPAEFTSRNSLVKESGGYKNGNVRQAVVNFVYHYKVPFLGNSGVTLLSNKKRICSDKNLEFIELQYLEPTLSGWFSPDGKTSLAVVNFWANPKRIEKISWEPTPQGRKWCLNFMAQFFPATLDPVEELLD